MYTDLQQPRERFLEDAAIAASSLASRSTFVNVSSQFDESLIGSSLDDYLPYIITSDRSDLQANQDVFLRVDHFCIQLSFHAFNRFLRTHTDTVKRTYTTKLFINIDELPSRTFDQKSNLAFDFDDYIQALRNIASLPDGWNGEDSLSPTDATISDARQFSAVIASNAPFVPYISASPDGAVYFDWRKNDKKVTVRFEGDGHAGYALFVGNRFKAGTSDINVGDAVVPEELSRYFGEMR